MRYTAPLLLLSSGLFHTGNAQNSDSEITASFESQGMCAYFYEKPGKWSPLANACVKWCENNGGHGYSECDRTPYKNMQLPNGIGQSSIKHDDAGDRYVPCQCKCDNSDVEGLANEILDTVIDGLSKLDEIICGVFMTAMVSVVEVGIDLVPGGAEATAAGRAVEAVKSFTENTLDIADSMGSWVGSACGIQDPNWPNSIFDVLGTSPDSYGTSIGCKKKNKADCQKVNPVPDKVKTKRPEDPVTKKPNSEQPTRSAAPTTSAKPTTSAAPTASVDPAVASAVPDFGIIPGQVIDGSGDCLGLNGVHIPCACPPDRQEFIQKVAAAVAAGNSEGERVDFPLDNSSASKKARIQTCMTVLKNLNGLGRGCPIASTTFQAQLAGA